MTMLDSRPTTGKATQGTEPNDKLIAASAGGKGSDFLLDLHQEAPADSDIPNDSVDKVTTYNEHGPVGVRYRDNIGEWSTSVAQAGEVTTKEKVTTDVSDIMPHDVEGVVAEPEDEPAVRQPKSETKSGYIRDEETHDSNSKPPLKF